MLLCGALSIFYALAYGSGIIAALGQGLDDAVLTNFKPATGKNGASLFYDVQDFNTQIFAFGIVILLLAVCLYITATNKRRNYYITNYIATGACSLGSIVLSIVAMAQNASWRAKFANIDFDTWKSLNAAATNSGYTPPYTESLAWFDVGFALYSIVIVVSILLVLNVVWKILLMKGEKQLLKGAELNTEVA
jgi:hypothetical protein